MISRFRNLRRAKGNQPGLLAPSTWNLLLDYLDDIEKRIRRLTPRSSAAVRFRSGPDGFTAQLSRISRNGTSAGICPFGEIIALDGSPAIRGGVIFCGDKTWNIDPQTINPATSGTWLVSIAVSVEVNRDDLEEILLPGIKTGTRPTGDWTKTAWTEETDYPDGTSPTAADGLGEIIIPIGKLTVAGGSASLEPVACGHITIGHCAGTLSHIRGLSGAYEDTPEDPPIS